MYSDEKKKFAAELSIISNIVLTLMKLIVGFISGSMSIISEAIHSFSDFFASILTYFSVMKSSQPADDDHPYGHGKYEDMAGFIEGLLIVFAAIFIIYKSVKTIIFKVPIAPENDLGITVMFISVIMNIFVSSQLFKAAKESNSVSLYADGEHLRTDVYSSLGVLIGLILIKITGHGILDPIIAIVVAVFIYRAGYSISKKSFRRLMDYSLPDEDIENIAQIITEYPSSAKLKANSIKARQTGPSTDIDLILQFPGETPICECHKVCDEIERRIQDIYKNSSISIHSEPICYNNNCNNYCNK